MVAAVPPLLLPAVTLMFVSVDGSKVLRKQVRRHCPFVAWYFKIRCCLQSYLGLCLWMEQVASTLFEDPDWTLIKCHL